VEDHPVADVVDAPGVEGAAPADEAVDLVALLEQELGQVAAVLARDPVMSAFFAATADLLPALSRVDKTLESTSRVAPRSKAPRAKAKGKKRGTGLTRPGPRFVALR